MTPAILAAAAGIALPLATSWAGILSAALPNAQITLPKRVAMFIAQVGHESEFGRLVENMNYTPEALRKLWPGRFSIDQANQYGRRTGKPADQEMIAILAYGGRMGNGRHPSRDGWLYRGRGLIQNTGRAAYAELSEALGADLLAQPQLLESPRYAAMAAVHYWKRNNLNALADLGDIQRASALINTGNANAPLGRINGLADRKTRYQRALNALGVK